MRRGSFAPLAGGATQASGFAKGATLPLRPLGYASLIPTRGCSPAARAHFGVFGPTPLASLANPHENAPSSSPRPMKVPDP